MGAARRENQLPQSIRHEWPATVYADPASARVEPTPLEGEHRTSVVVIGAGYTGLSTALHLAESGVEVTVLEAREIGWGASGRNGGQVNPGLKLDPDRVEADFGPDLGGRMVDFAWNSGDFLFDFIRRHDIACDARRSGSIRAAVRAKSFGQVQATYDQLARRGMAVELLDKDRVAAFTGTDRYLGAMLDTGGGHLNPLALVRGMARAARQAGVKIFEATAADHLTRAGARWTIGTSKGTVSAEKVLLAGNGYTDGLWPRLRRTIVPAYAGIVASTPLSAEAARRVVPSGVSTYEHGVVTAFYRVDAQRRLLMGGRCRQTPLGRPDQMEFLARYARQLWPDLGPFAFEAGWNGQIAITTDHYPHVHEPAEGVLAVLGCNGRGVALTTALGPQLARRLVEGAAAQIDLPVTPIRPVPFHDFWKLGVYAGIAGGRIKDRLDL